MSTSNEPGKILKLPDSVINLIAAGEVIQRPANAIKELIENSLDAGATEIKVTVKNGGTKLLQVQDNGSGILPSELELLCQRYTTSKLRQFDDLKAIHTYGFRGEALASISQVAHLTVVSRPVSSTCGYRAQFEGGHLNEKPKPCGCNPGTLITAEDLFYNMTDRRRALKSAPEEMKKIADVVSKYAVHNSRVSFSLKKQGETALDLKTPGGNGTSVTENCPTRLAISLVYGAALARELLHFQCDDTLATLAFTAEGYVTNPTYSTKKFILILFINNRLVECPALKKALELLYANYGPAKTVAPFVYLKIDITPENVDVNVHPTKQVVQFLHEREIIEALEQTVKKTLDTCNASKTFVVKQFPSSGDLLSQPKESQHNTSGDDSTRRQTEAKNGTQKKVEPHSMVRTDGRGRKLEEFFGSQEFPASQNIRVNFLNVVGDLSEKGESGTEERSAAVEAGTSKKADSVPAHVTDDEVSILYEDDARQSSWRPITLASVKDLQKAVQNRSSPNLRKLIGNHTFVGCLDPEYALVQFQTGLYVVNTNTLSREFFYQVLLYQFGNFGTFKLEERCRVLDLISWAMPSSMPEATKREKALAYCASLMERADMLWDYFSLQLVDGYLISIPCLFEKYIPQLEGLSSYVYRLATAVDYSSEEKCLDSICRETSEFYAFKKKYCHGDRSSRFHPEKHLDWRSTLETVLYPAMKSKLIPPETFDDSKTILKLTDMHDLYRVFERC